MTVLPDQQQLTNANVAHYFSERQAHDQAYGYEYLRWFRTKRGWLDYRTTYEGITAALQTLPAAERIFEMGTGPGTWTRLLHRAFPSSSLDLLDVSQTMRDEFLSNLGDPGRFKYNVGAFEDFPIPEGTYDLFASFRALEYLPQKDFALRKVRRILKSGGFCIFVTKNPSFRPRRLFTSPQVYDDPSIHSGMIAVGDLHKQMEAAGLRPVKTYGVTFRFPIIDRIAIRYSLKAASKLIDNPASAALRITESYLVVAQRT